MVVLELATSVSACGGHGEECSKPAMASACNCRKVASSGQGASHNQLLLWGERKGDEREIKHSMKEREFKQSKIARL